MRFISLSLLLLTSFAFGADCNTAGYPCVNIDSQVKGSRWPAFGTDSGTANAYAVTTVAPIKLGIGTKIQFIATNTNTGVSTLAVNGGTAISITKNITTALAANDISASQWVEVGYDGTNFQCLSCSASGGGSSSFNANSVTVFDDFLGNTTSEALGWANNGSIGGTIVVQPGSASGTNHQGIVEVSASTSSTSWEYYILGTNNGSDDFNPQGQTFKWYFRVNNQSGGSGVIRLGLFSNRGIQNPAGAYFESGTAQANTHWWCIQNNSGTVTSADSGITAPAGTYHTLEMDASATTTVVWKIDGTQVCNSIGGTNLLNQLLTIAAEASSTGTAPKVWLDYFRLDMTTSGR